MIDTIRRKTLALHLRHLSIGQIDTDEFEDLVMKDITNGYLPDQYYLSSENLKDDAAIRPILEYAWCLYGEWDYILKGKSSLDQYQLNEIARIILYLHAELEYDWEYVDMINPILRFSFKDILKSIFSFGKHLNEMKMSRAQEFVAMKKKGDFEYWPFKTKEQFERQLLEQPFLTGK